jgi:hypothetical protein
MALMERPAPKGAVHVSPGVEAQIAHPFSRYAEVYVGRSRVFKIGFEIVQGLLMLQWSFAGGFALMLQQIWTENQTRSMAFDVVVRTMCGTAFRDLRTARITDPAFPARRGQLAITEELAARVLAFYGARHVVPFLADAVRLAVHNLGSEVATLQVR